MSAMGGLQSRPMAHQDDHSERDKELRRFNRRAFLTGGAVVGGTVLWGSTNADAVPGPGSHVGRPIIPSGGTGGTGPGSGVGRPIVPGGTAAEAGVTPNLKLKSGPGGGTTGFTVETGFGPTGSSGAPLFRFRFR